MSANPAARAVRSASRWQGIAQTIGPGILMAGAAIGVSHLVQSTRAGADYGFQLIWLILLVTLLKYPFFEYGHRYAIAAGESMLHGYRRLGRFYLYAFFLASIVSALISLAGVTFVTASLAVYILPGQLNAVAVSAVLMGLCGAIVLVGRYRTLDVTVKVVIAVLVVTTLTAVAAALARGPAAPAQFVSPSPWNLATIGFLIALMGWMPLPIESSAWSSLWIGARQQQSGHRPTLRESLFDFRLGYGLMALTAVAFTLLGALVMHGSGRSFDTATVGFFADLTSLYTQSIGEWARPVIALAAFTAMFSTTLAVFDIYPRALAVAGDLVLPRGRVQLARRRLPWTLFVAACALFIISFFTHNLALLVDVSTTFAFLAAPLFAALNFVLIMSRHTPREYRPPPWLQALSWAGLVFLSGFSAVFLWAWHSGLVF